ncbi:hypothetical protein IMF23_04245 [Chelatococcus daeguensis]|uniref:hypothetical protein n=1 Tax=Chelatococcus daeguensis TaxID=444444 RepID=UPI0007AB48F4|nr:hypothetical protein [Chelatococcus daeguensis]KZE34089.1 hypothetical protein AVW15_17395 [Chelatococcus daeguensis]MBM3082646.1 hypothetical protein [Chelatococcus daeguensis]
MTSLLRRAKKSIAYRTRRAIHAITPPILADRKGSGFDHSVAQAYEIDSARKTIEEAFPRIIKTYDEVVAQGGLWQGANDEWFRGDEEAFRRFVDHVRNRKCLEIGSGPFGYLSPCYWIKDRVIIDPLIDQYRRIQIEMIGRTLFVPEITTYSAPAEPIIPDLVGAVDGAIICRNAIDHAEDPLAVLHTMATYAAPGCYLLFWTDIWHYPKPDEGHQNITKRPAVIDALIRGLGFEPIHTAETLRGPDEGLEYGCLARKVAAPTTAT